MAEKIKGLHFPSAELRNLGPLATEEERRQHAKEYDELISAHMATLMLHYGIKPSLIQYYELAIALARDMYPERKKAGRKSKWDGIDRGLLVVEVERLVKRGDSSHGVAWACKTLAQREPWKSFVGKKRTTDFGPTPAQALRQIYFDSRGEKWTEVVRDAYRWHERTDAIDKWERDLVDAVGNTRIE